MKRATLETANAIEADEATINALLSIYPDPEAADIEPQTIKVLMEKLTVYPLLSTELQHNLTTQYNNFITGLKTVLDEGLVSLAEEFENLQDAPDDPEDPETPPEEP